MSRRTEWRSRALRDFPRVGAGSASVPQNSAAYSIERFCEARKIATKISRALEDALSIFGGALDEFAQLAATCHHRRSRLRRIFDVDQLNLQSGIGGLSCTYGVRTDKAILNTTFLTLISPTRSFLSGAPAVHQIRDIKRMWSNL